ncbi:hypothetical protein IW261DRAFT_1557322 [Armillaria novae-zelandiae]|uniref:Uncharacterized protein n=1 Tax=Armillaria novae-zelandiae TaxID=153914 RepID=A0AA39PS87_9AGAR|nr:hypothetical protein IW261DRAFT_1557322 [Armillaria novae-zelandiae]
MSSLFSLPELHTQYQYFAKFDPVAHYNAYRKVFNILMLGKHQMPQGTKEELAAMLRTTFQFLRLTLIALKGQHLIDSRLPANLRVMGWDRLIRQTSDEMRPSHRLSHFCLGSPLPGGQCFSALNTPNPMEDYLLQQALPVVYGPPFLTPEENTAFPSVVFTCFLTPSPDDDDEDDGAEIHSMTVADALSEPEMAPLFPEPPFPPPPLPNQPIPTTVSQPPASPMALPMVLTVEQASVPSTSVVLPSVASLLSSRCPDAPLASSPLRASPMTAANFFLASPIQATPTRPNLQNLMEGHPTSPPANTGFQELACQMSWTVHPGSPHPILPAAGSSRSFDFAAFTPTQFDPTSLLCLLVLPGLVSPLPPVEGQGDFNPLPVPMVIITPSLPVITVLEDSPAATPPINELRSPSPLQIYHALSGEPLNPVVRSAPSSSHGPPAHPSKITSRKPKPCMLLKDGQRAYHCQLTPPPAPLSTVRFESALSSAKSPNKRKRSSSGKGKAVQMAPAISLPSTPRTRAHAHSSKVAMLPPSPDIKSEAEVETVPATKKPKLSSFNAKPKKKSKAAPCKKAHFMARSPGSGSDSETGGVSITQDTTRAELKALTFDDIQTVPHEFLLPVRYAGKNGTFGACSSTNPWFARAPDHYAVSCIPCTSRSIKCTWTNKFPGAACDQCITSHHGCCSAHYTAQEMNIVSTHIAPFAKYNISNIEWDLAQLHNANHELEHLDYLLHSRYLSCDLIIHEIGEVLDQLASHEDGNQIIEGLAANYEEVSAFIVNDGIRQSLGQSFDVPFGPSIPFDDADASAWELSDDEGLQRSRRASHYPNQPSDEDCQEGPSNSHEHGSDGGEFNLEAEV